MRSTYPFRCMRTALVTILLASAATLVATSAPAFAGAPDGLLDPTFGTGGKTTSKIGPKWSTASAVAVQPDGKIVVAGTSDGAFGGDIAVARYDGSGVLDPAFGTGGQVITPISNTNDAASAVAVQPDGKIVVIGRVNNSNDVAVVRYSAAGKPDPTFGSGGVVVTSVAGNTDGASGLVLQPDGKIVVVGTTYNGSSSDVFVMRYAANGLLDPAFGIFGKTITSIGSGYDGANAVALQPDGKIVVAGYSDNPTAPDVAVLRYSSTGVLDATFASGGKAITPIGIGDDYANSIVLQPDGKIVVAASSAVSSAVGSVFNLAVVRYTSNGGLDLTFGTGGKAADFTSSDEAGATAVALQSDGRIVLTGVSPGANDHVAIVRYTANGKPDPTFGVGGKTTTIIGTNFDYANAMAIQPDGKIVIAGTSSDVVKNYGFMVARYALTGPGLVTAVAPIRILDTRSGAKPSAGSITQVNPGALAGTSAVLVNITATGAHASGFVSADKCSTLNPTAHSNLNYQAGVDIANTAVVALDPDGTFCLYADQATNLIVDLQGSYQSNGMRLLTQNPTRVLDTRSGTKPGGNTITHVTTGAPAGSTAVLVTLTVSGAGSPGYITVNRCSLMTATPPPTSNANYQAGLDIANGAVVNIDPDGTFCIYASQTADLIVDIQGTYQTSAGRNLNKTAPTRILDTRNASKPLGNTITHVTTGAPAGTNAVLVNLTTTGAAASGYITADKCSVLTAGPQSTSNANYQTGIDIANTSVVNVDLDGSFCIYTDKPTHLIADLQGTY